jgi:hypothetical protein
MSIWKALGKASKEEGGGRSGREEEQAARKRRPAVAGIACAGREGLNDLIIFFSV